MAPNRPRDVVRGTVVRVPDTDDLWVAPDYFDPSNKYRYRHFKMMKLRSADIDGPERDEPGWHEAIRDLERRHLNQPVEVEIHTFDRRYNRFIARVYEFKGRGRGKEIWTGEGPARTGRMPEMTRAGRGASSLTGSWRLDGMGTLQLAALLGVVALPAVLSALNSE